MEIYLIRHTQLNVPKGICYGQTDLPLADSFQEEFAVLRNKIPEDLEAVYTSPLKRCTSLAQLIDEKGHVCDQRLLELNFGDWEMKPWYGIDRDLLYGWMKDYINRKPPNGESYLDLFERIKLFIDELLKKNHEKVAIISHAGVIRAIISYVTGTSLESSFNFAVDHGKVSLVSISGEIKRVKHLNL